jgi:hypothetical protein
MDYIFFNNEILMSDGKDVRRIEKGAGFRHVFESVDVAHVCVVDVDVLIAAAVEYPVEKKDSILVRKFTELYQHEAYIIQDEKIDNNLFQVIGIKEQKVREVYSLMPPEAVESFVPYGIALRSTLINKTGNLNKTVVFVDDLGDERLLTVFDGLKFSRTRVIANKGENILPEIKRSQIDFFKKTEEFLNKKSADFVIVVNNEALAAEISKNTEKLQVEYFNVAYPALEGLKETGASIKYRLPEENLKKRREIELKKKVTASMISLCIVAFGLVFFLFNKVGLGMINNQYEKARQTHERLDEQLKTLDKETYREDLRAHKSLNYGISYLSMLEIIPASYTVNSFKFTKTGQWTIEMTLFSDDGGIFDPIPRIKILKNAEIKDIFVNNQPGKHLKITL